MSLANFFVTKSQSIGKTAKPVKLVNKKGEVDGRITNGERAVCPKVKAAIARGDNEALYLARLDYLTDNFGEIDFWKIAHSINMKKSDAVKFAADHGFKYTRNTFWTEDREAILRDMAGKITPAEIGKRIGTTAGAVRAIASKLKISVATQKIPHPLSTCMKAEIIRLSRDGLSNKKIGEIVGTSAVTVGKFRRKQGIANKSSKAK